MSRDTHKRLFNCEQDNKAETSTNSCPTHFTSGLAKVGFRFCVLGFRFYTPKNLEKSTKFRIFNFFQFHNFYNNNIIIIII